MKEQEGFFWLSTTITEGITYHLLTVLGLHLTPSKLKSPIRIWLSASQVQISLYPLTLVARLLFIYLLIFFLTSNIPFQLSPVAILNKVNMAVPKSLKCACGPSPWQGWDGEHSVKHDETTVESAYEPSGPSGRS